MPSPLCDENQLQMLLTAIQSDDQDDLLKVDRLIADFPEDPRLQFLRGSILASIGRPIEALPALKRAVELAPDFAIARFQLGFFQLTSGEPMDALTTWGPIALLPDDHYLRYFAGGLTYLIRDDFPEAIVRLTEGIALNDENPVLNRDMQLIIDQVHSLRSNAAAAEPTNKEAAATSATSLLLDQLMTRRPSN